MKTVVHFVKKDISTFSKQNLSEYQTFSDLQRLNLTPLFDFLMQKVKRSTIEWATYFYEVFSQRNFVGSSHAVSRESSKILLSVQNYQTSEACPKVLRDLDSCTFAGNCMWRANKVTFLIFWKVYSILFLSI